MAGSHHSLDLENKNKKLLKVHNIKITHIYIIIDVLKKKKKYVISI